MRACQPQDMKRRQWRSVPARWRGSPLAPLFICFSLPLGLPHVNWASQECSLFYLKSSLQSSDLPLTFFCSVFTGFSLPCLLATAILDSCFLFYLPNTHLQLPPQTILIWLLSLSSLTPLAEMQPFGYIGERNIYLLSFISLLSSVCLPSI